MKMLKSERNTVRYAKKFQNLKIQTVPYTFIYSTGAKHQLRCEAIHRVPYMTGEKVDD